jgi:hypothetical protein
VKRARFLLVGTSCLLVALLVWAALKPLRTTLIVEFGVVAANTIRAAAVWTLVAIGLVAVTIGLYQLLKGAARDSSKDRLKRSILAYRAKTSGQKEIRDQLLIMKEARPKLSSAIDRCLGQLDSMTSQFDRFDQLITSNDADAVSGARVGFVDIDNTLCANFKWVINSSIAAEDDDSPEADAFYDQCTDRITEAVKRNNEALEKGNQFLLELADNISQTGTGDTTMLDAWLETIREQNKQSLIRMGDVKA